MVRCASLLVCIVSATMSFAVAGTINGFSQNNLVSDIPGMAAVTDSDLVNPWGVSFGPATPFWVSDNGSGKATLYNGAGAKQGLVVTMPAGATAVDGQVFNGTSNFNGDLFLFATEDGAVNGWRGALGTSAETLFTVPNGVLKGLATATIGTNTYLYAADFRNGGISVFPGAGAPPLTGSFVDPGGVPNGYAPFNIENIGGQLYVTYAVQDAAKHDDVAGAGNGFIDVFDLQGNFLKRLVDTGGVLNSPWGMALAPASFGSLGGDLLVGNFGDGMINAFTLSGTWLGSLASLNGTPITNDGLWALTFGNGGAGGRTDTLYVTAGLNGESDGLFASITAVPEPGTLSLLGLGVIALVLRKRRFTGWAG